MSGLAAKALSFLSRIAPTLVKGAGRLGGSLVKGIGRIGSKLIKGFGAAKKFVQSGSAAEKLARGAELGQKAGKLLSQVGAGTGTLLGGAELLKQSGIIKPTSQSDKIENILKSGQSLANQGSSSLFNLSNQLNKGAGFLPQA